MIEHEKFLINSKIVGKVRNVFGSWHRQAMFTQEGLEFRLIQHKKLRSCFYWFVYLFIYYTLLIEGILVLSIRVRRIEIFIWDPRFLGDIWSVRNSKAFELCLSVRPSVVITIASERKELRKWVILVHRIWYLPYKSNRYTGFLSTWNFRFTP